MEAQIITTVAGSGAFGGDATGGFSGDGEYATHAQLDNPIGVTVDSKGNFYISDDLNRRIRKVDTNGIIRTIAGHGASGYAGDNGPATAAVFAEIPYLLVLHDTDLFLPDDDNSRIRLINLNTGIINTFAGSATAGFTGDGGPATLAELCTPFGISSDNEGNIYYADDACSRIRKINISGVISSVAGDTIAGYLGDGGPATNASLYHPLDVAVDFRFNIYISGGFNNCIRKVDSNGIISTYAGTGGFGYTGDNGPATNATFDFPEGIAVDGAGNLFVADVGNDVIRKIDTLGIITTVVGNGYNAGTGNGGFSGDGGPATAAELNSPTGVAFDKHGNLFIADWYNNRIRKVTNVGVPLGIYSPEPPVTAEDKINIYPNPAVYQFTLTGASGCDATIYDLVGSKENAYHIQENKQTIDITRLSKGTYTLEITDPQTGMKIVKRLVKE
jgi:hypothetical protein